MAKRKISRRWIEWRRWRYWELGASGLPSHLAWDAAKAETAARQRVARVVGFTAATKAELACVERDGDLVFFLVGAMVDLRAGHKKFSSKLAAV